MLLVLLALASACGAGVTFDGQRFAKDTAAYRIGPLPSGFEPVQVEDYDLAFADPGRGTISVNALCEGYQDVPPTALRNHLLFGFTDLDYVLEDEWVVAGRSALHTIADAELDGAPVRVETVVLVRGGCVFDLAYVSDRSARAHEDFARFVQAFAVERTEPRDE